MYYVVFNFFFSVWKKNGSVVKQTGYSWKGSEFSSQHLCGDSQPLITPVPVNLMPSPAHLRHCSYVVCRHTCRQTNLNTHKSKKKNFTLIHLFYNYVLFACFIFIHMASRISKNQIQVVRLGGKPLYSLSHLISPM